MSNDLLVQNDWHEKEIELINYDNPKIIRFKGKHKNDKNLEDWEPTKDFYKDKIHKIVSEVGQMISKQKDYYHFFCDLYPHLTTIVKKKFVLFKPLEKNKTVAKIIVYKDEITGEMKLKTEKRRAIVQYSRIFVREQLISFIKQSPFERIFIDNLNRKDYILNKLVELFKGVRPNGMKFETYIDKWTEKLLKENKVL